MDLKFAPAAQKATESKSIRDILNRYLKHWIWFALSCTLFLTGAFFHLRYAIPQYTTTAKIMLTEDKTIAPQTTVFQDLGIGGTTKKIDDEIQIITSRRVISNVVKKLKLNIQYFTQGNVLDLEMYPYYPVNLNFIASDSIVNKAKFTFFVDINSENSFTFWMENDEDNAKTYLFGKNVPTPVGDVIITPPSYVKKFVGQVVKIKVVPVETVTQNLKNSIGVSPISEYSNVLQISLNYAVNEKARDIINTLIAEYNQQTIDEKALVAKNTADFISKRIDLIATDLADVDNTVERFKTGNRLTDITSEADIYLSTSSQNEQELVSAGTELNMVNFMKDAVNTKGKYETVPSNVGLSDPTISNITSKYNELILERQRLLKSSNEKNPVVVNLDQQLDGLRETLKQSLNNMSNSLNIRVNNLKNQGARLSSRISSVPGQERELRDIQRQQQIKEALYLYLLQKREESAIAMVTTAPDAKIVDSAYSQDTPVTPKRKMVYLAALIFGLAVPFSVIYIKDLLDNKVHNKEDLEKLLYGVPVLAELPRVQDKKESTIQPNDRSVLAESFRILRTNLDYYIRKDNLQNRKSHIIYVTSTINGEGKSFTAFNLALTLAYSNKKVLILGADVRNPGLNLFMHGSLSEKGLTEYLSEPLRESDIISNLYTDDNLLDIIQSGKIPPNPAELLMSNKLENLFDYLRSKYDYIVVDTAPCMLVTDTLLISKYADHTVYVTRSEYTEKKMMSFTRELFEAKKLNNMLLVVNDVNATNFGYGAKYGYGYYGNSKKGKKQSVGKTVKKK